MRVLALNPYGAGSHVAFLEGWRTRSRHAWTVVDLPGWNWRWRMRGAAIELADRVARLSEAGGAWDVVVCTDMMNAAEWRGLAPPSVGRLPLVVYFHENQAAYPAGAGGADARDVHFILTNMVSVLAADEAWFNSAYNLRTLVEGVEGVLGSIPGAEGAAMAARVRARSRVEPPGVDDGLFEVDRRGRAPGALRILWAARWEHDKRPEVFAAALERLAGEGVAFRVDVLGRGPREGLEGAGRVMEGLRARLGSERVGRFGHAETREAYVSALAEADVIVSTAAHEFFGLAVVEAAASGALAVVPRDLAYPEVLGEACAWHDGTEEGVCRVLRELAGRVERCGSVWAEGHEGAGRRAVEGYRWSARASVLDEGLARVARRAGG